MKLKLFFLIGLCCFSAIGKSNEALIERHRMWINLSNSQVVFNQILVGYIENATMAKDTGIDAVMFGYEGNALYSLIENETGMFVIQGRALPFNADDIVPLGFRAVNAGTFTISLSNFDGLFLTENQDIFIKDNFTQTYHNIKESAYQFTTEVGIFDYRFELIYHTTDIAYNVVWTAQNQWMNSLLPDNDKNVMIVGDLVVNNNFSAKTLEVVSSGSIVIPENKSVTVSGKITNKALATDFIVENGGSLIQTENTSNLGNITVRRNSNPMFRLDYTLWSSPVANQGLQTFSPETLPNRIYKYDALTNSYYNPEESTFIAGQGYLFRSPNDWIANENGNSPQVYQGVFTGVPNNGNFQVNVIGNAHNGLGNPYPSAITANSLLSQGLQTLYFWTNTNPAQNNTYDGQPNNWASYTMLGGTAATGSGATPNGQIAPGQGFLALVNSGVATVNFTNAMRSPSSGMFFRQMDNGIHRFWLNLSIEETALNQILIGYIDGATYGVDNQIDGVMFGYEGNAIYSIIEDSEEAFVIQGLPTPFNVNDHVGIGFRAVESGTFTITLSNFDGLFEEENQDIYLKDNLTNITHNLKENPYTFTSEEGVFDTRFEVVYQPTLSSPDFDFENNWIAFKQGNSLHIETVGFELQEVALFDILGRKIYTSHAEGNKHEVTKLTTNGVIIVKITTQEGKELVRKVSF
jgi:hypothetical protein